MCTFLIQPSRDGKIMSQVDKCSGYEVFTHTQALADGSSGAESLINEEIQLKGKQSNRLRV